MPAKGKGGHGKGKKVAKPKVILPSLSSDDGHDDATPDVPDVPIISTPNNNNNTSICYVLISHSMQLTSTLHTVGQ